MKIQPLAFSTISLLAFVLAGGPLHANNKQATEQPSEATQEARLGIGVSPLPEVLKKHLPEVIADGRGILVSEVVDGSPAEKAGIQKYDVLVRYDDQDLYSPEQLVKRVRNDDPGKTVELQFVHAGKLQTVKVQLGRQAKKESVFSQWDWPGFVGRFDVPWSPLRPEYWTEAQDIQGDGTEWTSFESLTVKK
ncbi:MAG: PDZ domain-containing protein, partial [Planctomycetales bacterium]|nr:PDZ domain-containing protein [Planctomycetales bacterium]